MTEIEVWPALGTTVTLESGYVITAEGASTLPYSEIVNLIRGKRLLTYDPTGVNPNPSPLPPDSTDGSFSSVAATALAVDDTADQGEVSATYGQSAVLDGAEGLWFRDTASTATADSGTVLGSGTGRWKRFRERTNFFNIMWYGAKNTGADNPLSALYADWAAVQAAYPHIQKASGESDADAYTRVSSWDVNDAVISKVIALASPGCAEIYFPAGTYRITRPIVLSTLAGTDNINSVNNGNGVNNLKLRGANLGSTWFPQTYILWDGLDTTLPIIFLSGSDQVIEDFTIRSKWGRTAYSGVEIGWDTTTTRFVHGGIVRNCYIWADGDTDYWTDGSITHGVTIGGYQPPGLASGIIASLEDSRISHCLFRSMQDSMVWIAAGQPFNTIIESCRFWQYRGAGLVPGEPLNIHPYGTGIRVSTSSTDVHVQNCEFQAQARVVDIRHPAPIRITGCCGENIKRLIHTPTNSPSTGMPIRVEGGRWYARIEQESRIEDPYGQIASNDPWILHLNNNQVGLHDMYIHCSYLETEFTLRFSGEANVLLVNCSFPFNNIIRRENASDHIGHTFITGCSYASTSTITGATYDPMGSYSGCNTPHGYVDISDANTTATVVMNTNTREENDLYLIQLTAESKTGTPTMSAPYVTSKGTTSFQITLPSAPGVGNTVRVYYHLSR